MSRPSRPEFESHRARTERASHSRRLLLFAALGYGYLLGLVALLLGVSFLVVAFQVQALLWLTIPLLFFVLSALWVRLPAPEGRRITRKEAPHLFALIEEVREALDAPAPHEVLLSADVNACIMDRPRFGLLGSRRALIVGLPLLHALPPDEARAILAHEFGHLSRRHGRSRAWTVRLGATWNTLALSVQWTRNWAAMLFVPFFRWYAPRFDALVEAASRGNELESDRLAVQVAGREAMARALVRTVLAETCARRVLWPGIRRDSAERETPPSDAVPRLLEGLDGLLEQAQAAEWLRLLLRDRALEGDSHPALADRLEAMGAPATPDQAEALIRNLRGHRHESAAQALLGPEIVSRLASDVSDRWKTVVRNDWRQWHSDARIWRQAPRSAAPGSSDRPVEGPGGGRTDSSASWARARWAAVCEPPEVAIPLLKSALADAPGHAEARMLLGRLLLERGDPQDQRNGATLLEGVMAEDSLFAFDAADALQRHHAREGRSADVRRTELRKEQLRRDALSQLREQGTLRYGDTLRPWPLPAPTLADLHERLREHPRIHRAWLVRKRTRHLGATPVAALAVTFRGRWYKPTLGVDDRRTVHELIETLTFPESINLVVVPLGRRSRVCRRLRKLDGAEVYRRGATLPKPQPVEREWSTPSAFSAAWSSPVVILGGWFLFGALVAGSGAWLGSMERPAPTLAELREAVQETPADPAANLELAWALIDRNHLDEALPVVRHAARLNPGNPYAHNSLGWVLMQLGHLEESLPSFRTAIELDPDHEFAHGNLGRALIVLERPEEALPHLEEAIRLKPEEDLAYRDLGWALHGLERDVEAESPLREAVRIAPRNADARFGLGLVLERLRRLEEAERELREAVRLNPAEPNAAGSLANLLKNQGRVEDALAVFRDALVHHGDDPWLWGEVGVLEHFQERHPEATAAFEEV